MIAAPLFMLVSLASAAPPAPVPPAPAPSEAGPPVAELLEQLEGCQEVDCAPLRALVARGERVWPELEKGLDHPKELVRFWSIGVLAEVPVAGARGRLLGFVRDEPLTRIRAASAFALAGYPGADVTTALVAALGDHDPNVRFEAASAIGRRAPEVAVLAPLVKVLDDADEDVRGAAAEALGVMGAVGRTPEVEAALLAKVNDRKPAVRGRVAIALGQLGVRAAVAPLVKRAEREKDAEALAAMAWALGELKDPAAVEPLKKLAGHADPVVKKHAEEALDKLLER